MIRQLRFAAIALFLASCATVVDGQIQDVTIETVGASNTLCYMQNNEFSFRFYPPQTLKVTKSRDPYKIRCLAPGNREKTIMVEPVTTDSTFYNIANLGTGVALDHISAAMYELPDKIVISFEGMEPTGYEQPPYNRFFDRNPQLKGVEEFRPGQAALMSDAGKTLPALKARETQESGDVVFGSSDPLAPVGDAPGATLVGIESLPPVPSGSKSMSAESLTRSMNPGIFGGSTAPAATSMPVPIQGR